MAQRAITILIAAGLAISAMTAAADGKFEKTPLEQTVATAADNDAPRSAEAEALVQLALSRYEEQGLELPEVNIQFLESREACGYHLGLYIEKTRSLYMCSLDKSTMFHELAHAWANNNLTEEQKEAFADMAGLDTWNDHDMAWKDRATEHAAETIAWGLNDDANHVRWVETGPSGETTQSYIILSLGIDVETLSDNFRWLTGSDSLYRSPSEWPPVVERNDYSPEASRG